MLSLFGEPLTVGPHSPPLAPTTEYVITCYISLAGYHATGNPNMYTLNKQLSML